MVAIAADPLVMNAVLFSIQDPDTPATFFDYECHVSAVELAPEQEVIDYQTLCPDGSFQALGREKFALNITAVQDWSADGFTRFCWENAGKEAEVKFTPSGISPVSADNPMWLATVTIPRPTVGGEVQHIRNRGNGIPGQGHPDPRYRPVGPLMAGAKPKIEVTGARELNAALRKMAGRADDLKAVHQRLAAPLVALARLEAPTRSGALAGSVRASATKRALGLRAGSRGYRMRARSISDGPPAVSTPTRF